MSQVSEMDRAFIKQSDLWPKWPLLPIKRYVSGQIETALVYANMEGPTLWCEGANLWGDNSNLKWVDFDLDELLEQGWVVD